MNVFAPRLGFALVALGLTGCPEENNEPEGLCDGAGEPQFALWQRAVPNEIVDGSELPVFPPPQGGVFSEMDVTITGVTDEQIDTLQVEITDEAGTALAVQSYNGAGLPLVCQNEGELRVDNMPIGFYASTVLQDLEGIAATMTVTLTTTDEGDATLERAVTLRVSGY